MGNAKLTVRANDQVFDCGVVLHLKLGNPHFTDPVSHLAPCDVFTGCCKITERISSLLALDTGLSPGAPVNNCRWASTQKTGPSFKQQALDRHQVLWYI